MEHHGNEVKMSIMDKEVYAIIAIEAPNGDVTMELIKDELIIDAFDRLLKDKPGSKVRLFMTQYARKFFINPNIKEWY